MRLIQAIEYDKESDPKAICLFPTVEKAIAWCEERRGAELSWGDTNFGYNGMTEEERDASADPPYELPARWYEVHGVEEDGTTIRELEDEDHENGVSR